MVNWIELLKDQVEENTLLFLIGTKNDLLREEKKMGNIDEIDKFVNKYGIKQYFSVSSKADDNVDNTFEKIFQIVFENYTYNRFVIPETKY